MSAMPNPHFLSPQNTCSNEPYLKSSKNIPRTFHQDYHNKFSSSGNPAAYRTGPMNISSNFPTREGFYQQFGPERNRIKGQRQSSPSHFNKFNRELSPKAAFLQQTIKKRATSPNERFKNIPNSPPQYINRNLPPNFQKEQDFFKFNRTVPESNLNINMSPNRYRKLEHQEQIPNRSFDLFNSRVVEHNPNNRQNFEYINPRVPEFRQNKGPLEFNPQMPEFIQRAKMPYDNRGGPPEFSELNPYGRDLPPYPQSFRNPMQGSTAPETEYRPHVKLPPPNGEFYRELPNSMSFAPGLDKNVGLNREPESFLEKYGVLNGGLQRRPESFLERSRSLQRGPESFIERNRVFNQGPEFSDRNPGFNRDPEFLKRNMDLLNRGPEFFDRNITLNRGPEPLERNPDFNRAQESFPGRPIRDDYLLKPSMKRPFEFRDDFVLQPPIINRQYNDFGPFSANLPDFSSDIHKPIELGNSFRAPFFKSDTSTFKSRTFDEYQSFKPQSFDEFLPSVPINFPQHNFNNYSPHKSEMKGSRFEEQKKIHLDKDFDEIVDALKEYIFFER